MAKKDVTALLNDKIQGKKNKASLTEALSSELKKNFSLEKFKDKKLLNSNILFKPQVWIPFSEALQDVLGVPGIPHGHVCLFRGHSNTGKSTALIECAISAQKMNILPVFIITEMKHSWEHLKTMGFQMEDVIDKETGEVTNHDGFFLYKDRSTINSIEDVASFILDILDEQKKGNLPYDLLFLWDSVGSIPCQMSIEHNSNNPMWNAGAINAQFGNFVNQRFPMSRKEDHKYTNTLAIVNKVGVAPAANMFSQPTMTNKGGNTLFYDATFTLTFGNVTNSGTSKIKAMRDKKQVEFALRTKVQCDKNHANGIQTKGTLINTIHGFIPDKPNEIEKYKKLHAHEWLQALGGTINDKIDIVEDDSEWEESNKILPDTDEQ